MASPLLMPRKSGNALFAAAVLAIFVVLGAGAVYLIRSIVAPSLDTYSVRDVGKMDQAQRIHNATSLIGPQPEHLTFDAPNANLQLPEDVARATNARQPLATLPRPPAPAFSTRGASVTDWVKARDCLTAAVYYESNGQPLTGQRAVAQVVLNRVRHPAFPPTVCGVVFQRTDASTGCQFTFTCDGSLSRVPDPNGWLRARAVADDALAGYVEHSVSLATHYHADYVVPYWSKSLAKLAVVGAHIFYRWNGSWGDGRAFGRGYHGGEPAIPWKIGTALNNNLLTPDRVPALVPNSAPGAPPLGRPMLPWASDAQRSDGTARPVVSLDQRQVIAAPEPTEAPPPSH